MGRSKQSFHTVLNGVPFLCASQHYPSGWPRYSASGAVSPRSEKRCPQWRTFLGLTDLAQGGDPGMAARTGSCLLTFASLVLASKGELAEHECIKKASS